MDKRGIFLRWAALLGAALAGAAVLLAWVSSGFQSVSGWGSFVVILLAAAGVSWLSFQLLKKEDFPRWLVWLVIGAAALRLALGAFWFAALPEWGYPNEIQQAGYVMFDPFLRDGKAWDLAQSDLPLSAAFQGYTSHDQYGGLLYISALIYRTLGGSEHLPLQVVAFGAIISGLAVLFAWGFARRLWGAQVAALAAWGIAFYPEAVFLGSSQMREAFTIPLGAALAYLLVRWWQDRRPVDLAWFGLLALITGLITWAYLILLGVVLGLLLLGLWLEQHVPIKLTLKRSLLAAGLGALAIVAASYLWNILTRMSAFQGYLTERASGMMQAVYDRLPEFLHVPFMVGYGVVRPLLPAVLIEHGESALWRWVGIMRSAGWTVLLVLLVYTSFQVIRKGAWFKSAGMLVWGNWLMVLVASFRAGGDMWDNPRYRAGFAAFQLALVGWALVQQRADRDPLLRRIIVAAVLGFGVLILWYLPRYTAVPWSSGRIENWLAAGVLIGGLYWLWDWRRVKRRRNQ